ncbi:hypothetical protein ACFLRY_01595 [Bacteroidota bacterium]
MKSWLKYLIIIILLGILGVFLFYNFYINKSHPEYENLEAVYTLNASKLYFSYKSDKELADSNYTGKMLQISGALSSVEKHDTIITAVFVFDEGMFGDEGVRCSFLPKFHKEVLDWQKDEIYTIKGLCLGFNDTDVILDKCSIK